MTGPVVPNREAKSSGRKTPTRKFDRPADDPPEIARDGSARRRLAGAQQLLAGTVTIKVRYADFTTITRSHSSAPTRDEADVTARAVQLLDKTERPAVIRLLGRQRT